MTDETTGTVFDIRRFSTHDGAGIRTTVFLKGCPLRCAWCQNPEGIDPRPKLTHFPGRCMLCGLCLAVPDGAARMEGGKLLLDAKKAARPALYEDICPAAALRMDARPFSVGKLADVLARDLPFFRRGGGVTLSGGEPFFQGAFTLALLKALKASNLHTAVETSLFAEWPLIEAALPYIDTLFADIKIADGAAHKLATGVGNERILENAKRALRSPYRDRVVVRTPLIPKFTATRRNIEEISKKISACYPSVQYELLNYNPLAKAKYAHMSYAYCFEENPPLYTAEQMAAFAEIARRSGARRACTT